MAGRGGVPPNGCLSVVLVLSRTGQQIQTDLLHHHVVTGLRCSRHFWKDRDGRSLRRRRTTAVNYIHASIYSSIPLHTYHPFIYHPSFHPPINQSSIFSSTHPSIYPSLTNSSFHSFIYPLSHQSIHPFMHPSIFNLLFLLL